MKEIKQHAPTEKQKKFIEAYCAGLTPYDAACHAGYAMDSAKTTARRLLHTPHIQTAIQERQDAHGEDDLQAQPQYPDITINDPHSIENTPSAKPKKTSSTNQNSSVTHQAPHISKEAVVRELAAIGFASVEDICQWSEEGVSLRDSSSISRAHTSAIAEVRESGTARGGVQIKMHSKLRALEMLGRHLGMFSTASAQSSMDISIPPLPDLLRHKLHAVYGDAGRYDSFDYVDSTSNDTQRVAGAPYTQCHFDEKNVMTSKESLYGYEFDEFDECDDYQRPYDEDDQNDVHQDGYKHTFFS